MERKLWYRRPAAAWEEALPLGGGRLGMMVFGGIETERIQLTEETMWAGYPHDNDNPLCREHLPAMRRLIFEGKIAEAEELCKKHLVCREGSGVRYTGPFGSFEPVGDLYVQMVGRPTVDSRAYRRELDLFDGIATVSFGNTVRRSFVSVQYGVTVTEIVSKENMQLKIRLDANKAAPVYEKEGNILARGAFAGEGASSFCTVVSCVAEGGDIKAYRDSESEGVFPGNTCRVIIYTATATSYDTDKDPETACRASIARAKEAGFDRILTEHLSSHREMMERATFTLGGEDRSELSTDERLEAICRGEQDTAFSELYFNYGKYLLIAASTNCRLPSNLQGIWVKDATPPWGADFHININLQMMYWHAEVLGLTEQVDPLCHYIEDLARAGEKTAAVQYGCRGWVAHTLANPWGFTAPGADPSWGAFATAGAWCCRHIWERYLYSGDAESLKRYYPVIRGSALFFLDFLVEDPRTGCLITAPANSPENHYRDPKTGEARAMCAGPTMDNCIVRELLQIAVKAAEILGEDEILREEWRKAEARIPQIRIGKLGQIMEWAEDYEEVEPGHRHISHLYALYPGNAISAQNTPELFEAARVTLRRRIEHGSGQTGWSAAWIVCFFARLFEGDEALSSLLHLYKTGTYRNLFDHHPTVFFQIDGNLGATAGMAEMLLQSHEDIIRVLPACPSEWKSGEIKGFRARGGFLVDASWEQGNITSLSVRSLLGRPLSLLAEGKTYSFATEAEKTYKLI